MTSETPSLHASKNLNIFKTKQDIEKLKTPLRLAWKCCSALFKIGSRIFSLQWHFNNEYLNAGSLNKALVYSFRFGSEIRSPTLGFVYNNQMDDFSTPGLINVYGLEPSPKNFIKPKQKDDVQYESHYNGGSFGECKVDSRGIRGNQDYNWSSTGGCLR